MRFEISGGAEVLDEFDRGDAFGAHSLTMQWAIRRVGEWMDEKLGLGRAGRDLQHEGGNRSYARNSALG